MTNNYNPFNGGKAAFWKGKAQKPLNDKKFMQYYETVTGEDSSHAALREAKQASLKEWKAGWRAAKEEAENPAPVTKKKTSKKKKVSKKKSKK